SYMFWNDIFYRWNGNFYVKIRESVFKSEVTWFVESVFNKYFFDTRDMYLANGEDPPKELKKPKINRNLVSDVIMSLVHLLKPQREILENQDVFWINDEYHEWKTSDVIPFRNGLVNIRKYLNKEDNFIVPLTCRLFYTYSLGFCFPDG